MIKCPRCQTDFNPNSKKQIYCSSICRVYNFRKNKPKEKKDSNKIAFFVLENGKKIPFSQDFLSSLFDEKSNQVNNQGVHFKKEEPNTFESYKNEEGELAINRNKKTVNIEIKPEPKEGSAAFFFKHGFETWAEVNAANKKDKVS